MRRHLIAALAAVLVPVTVPAAHAFDSAQTFRQGSFVVSPEVAYGQQINVENQRESSDVEFVNGGVRFGWLPFSPVGPGPLHGAFEIGLEPVYQRYLDPHDAFFAGLAATFRYHFLSLGRFVPYVDVAGAAGGTDLKIPEIRSNFTFMVWGGVGAAYFLTERTALYGGYRFTHVSNGNIERPNRGFEAHTGVLGVSFFFQ